MRIDEMPDGAPGDKPTQRRRLLQARARLSAQEHAAAAAALVEALLPLAGAGPVAAYASVGTEPSTDALLVALPEVLLPVLLPDGDLDWARADGPLVPGPRGLQQPTGARLGPDAIADCPLVVVPALAVDLAGTRLGRGGGSYDRALARRTRPRGRRAARGRAGAGAAQRAARPAGRRRRPAGPGAGGADGQGGGQDGPVSTGFDDLLAANRDYAATYPRERLAGRAARGLAVVTCMDSRIEPLQMLGLSRGDAKILRNAGARVTDDVLRTLVLAVHLLSVERIMVVTHTDCRMATVTDEQVHASILEQSGLDTRSLEFRTMDDQLTSLAQDVQRVRSSPYLPAGLPVAGCRYDVETGRLEIVVPPS